MRLKYLRQKSIYLYIHDKMVFTSIIFQNKRKNIKKAPLEQLEIR